MLKNFRFLLLFSALFIGAPYTIATAQDSGEREEVEIEYDSDSLLPRSFYTIEMFNNPSVSESKFTMRLASYGEVSGCADMSKSTVTKKETFEKVGLEVRDSEIRVRRRQTRYTNYDCDTKQLKSFVDVELDRDELIENKIKKISLTSKKYGDFSEAEIKVTKEKIEHKVTANGTVHMTTFWFFPQDAVALVAPNAKQGQDIKESIRAFGEKNGLISIEESFKGYELPHNANNYVMFNDPQGAFANKVESPGKFAPAGSITLARTVYGPNGAEEEPYTTPIMVTRPGQPAP